MQTIWKYTLALKEAQSVLMRAGSKILSIQSQQGVPTMWAQVNPEAPATQKMEITIVGTGEEVPNAVLRDATYVDTVQMGEYVWHFFAREL